MNNNIRFVVLGDLIADLYYNGDKLIGVDGGSERFNVVANLAYMNCDTAAIGGCGNDTFGKKVLKRYANLGVDVSRIRFKDKPIRAYHLTIDQAMLPKLHYECSLISPVDFQNTWYDDSLDDIEYCKSYVTSNDVVILDKLDDFSLYIINNFDCYKTLDIGTTNKLETLTNDQIMALRGNFSLIQFNERVIPYIMQRFNFTNISELYELFQPGILTITRGKKGADFIFQDKIISKKIANSAEEIDPTGAGDAFFSVFIKEYFYKLMQIDEDFISRTFSQAFEMTSDVVRHIGARGHIQERILDKLARENDEYEREIE